MMLDWRSVVADMVIESVCEAAGGLVPETVGDWTRVCGRFSLCLAIVEAPGQSRAVLLDDVIVVRRGVDERETCCRIAHEVTEWLLCSDGERPYAYCSALSSEEERHGVACLVEVGLGLSGAYAARCRNGVLH